MAFKYNILLRTLPTNKYLFICKLIETQAYCFCEIITETIQHLFGTVLLLKTSSLVALKNNKINLNCLFMQKYIFVTRSRSSVLCFGSFIIFIKYHYEMENGIAFLL